MVPIAVAVTSRDFGATAVVDIARAATHAADVICQARAIVVGGCRVVVASRLVGASWNLVVVANAVTINIRSTGASADTNGVQLVTVTVAVSSWDVGTATVVDGTGAVADSAGIEVSDAVIHVVTDAILVCVCSAVTAAFVQGVQLVSVTVAVSRGDLRAATVVDVAGAVTDATGIEGSHAVVHVVTDAVLVGVS